MKRREKYLRKCISALALAGMLMVSVRPLSASAESVPGADTRSYPRQICPAGMKTCRKGRMTPELRKKRLPEMKRK